MNPKLDFIFNRRSIRAYKPGEVSDEVVRDLLEAAMAAPSACEMDPWHFVVVKNRDTLNQLADGHPYGKMLADASLAIVVCGSLEDAHDVQLSYLLQDCSAATENLLIAASTLGLGAVWLGVHPREARMEMCRAVLNIPEKITPLAILAIGFPNEKKKPRTRFSKTKVHEEKW